MFLGGYLFFMSIGVIIFCCSFLNVIYIDIDKKNKLTQEIKQEKSKDKIDYKDQLAYITKKQELELDKTQLFYYKICIFLVAVYVALNTRMEPLYIYGYKLGFFSNLFIIVIISVIQSQTLKKIFNINL